MAGLEATAQHMQTGNVKANRDTALAALTTFGTLGAAGSVSLGDVCWGLLCGDG